MLGKTTLKNIQYFKFEKNCWSEWTEDAAVAALYNSKQALIENENVNVNFSHFMLLLLLLYIISIWDKLWYVLCIFSELCNCWTYFSFWLDLFILMSNPYAKYNYPQKPHRSRPPQNKVLVNPKFQASTSTYSSTASSVSTPSTSSYLPSTSASSYASDGSLPSTSIVHINPKVGIYTI